MLASQEPDHPEPPKTSPQHSLSAPRLGPLKPCDSLGKLPTFLALQGSTGGSLAVASPSRAGLDTRLDEALTSVELGLLPIRGHSVGTLLHSRVFSKLNFKVEAAGVALVGAGRLLEDS